MRYNYHYFENDVCYLNPPFRGDYLQISILQIINKKIDCYIILPKWPSAMWYILVLQYADVIIEIPNGTELFKSPEYMTTRLLEELNSLCM